MVESAAFAVEQDDAGPRMAGNVTQAAMGGGALSALRFPHDGDSHRLRLLEFKMRGSPLYERQPFNTLAGGGVDPYRNWLASVAHPYPGDRLPRLPAAGREQFLPSNVCDPSLRGPLALASPHEPTN